MTFCVSRAERGRSRYGPPEGSKGSGPDSVPGSFYEVSGVKPRGSDFSSSPIEFPPITDDDRLGSAAGSRLPAVNRDADPSRFMPGSITRSHDWSRPSSGPATERLAGVQGAAISPLVAGTRPATSGMEAIGPSPSRRHDPPIVTTRDLDKLIIFTCPLVQAVGVARPSRERSRSSPPRHPPPGLRPSLTSSSGWRLRGESGPSGRDNLLSVPIRSLIDHHLLRSSTDNSKPGPGRRAHLTHGPLAEGPEPSSVTPSSPVRS